MLAAAPWRHKWFAGVTSVGSKGTRHQFRQLSSAFERRENAFNEEKARQRALWEKKKMEGNAGLIEVLLPDGSKKVCAKGSTTPLEIAQGISGKMAKTSLIAQLNGNTLWDMSRPLEDSCQMDLLPFQENNDRLTNLFWHSSAHVLGMSLEAKYGSRLLLCDGPAIKQGGFFYEFLLLNEDTKRDSESMSLAELLQLNYPSHNFSQEELADLHRLMNQFIAQRLPFERLSVTQEFAYNLFPENKFKQHFISNIPQDSTDITLYKCGSFVDLCRGPHVQHTGQLGALEILRTSNAYFMPELNKDPKSPQALTRMYGISFPSAKELKQWHHRRNEAEKRDHRTIGKNQELFAVHSASPGSIFMLPHGTRIVERLMHFMRQQYRKYGFEEVMTPLMYKKELWETSGHWQNYKDDMFQVMRGCDHHHDEHAHGSGTSSEGSTHTAEGRDEIFGLKPMNCPGHCLIFDMSTRSYKDLPIRYADFSALHRNESTGSLSGLTRVRRFHQDDAHIFCTRDQIFQEIKSTLSFVKTVYKTFKFPSYELALSTRPLSGFIGTVEEWDAAENALRQALDQSGQAWTINEGDGAFYGPKIDILVRDALDRRHQTATIQLDFQLPQRFGLQFYDAQGEKQSPVIVHRAVLGSVERMMAILIEHTGGRWPFWLSPRQAIVVPVFGGKAGAQNGSVDGDQTKGGLTDYAVYVKDCLTKAGKLSYGAYGDKSSSELDQKALTADADPVVRMDHKHYYVDMDQSGGTLNKMVRDAQVAQYNFILVVGEKEKERGTVNVRSREGERLGEMTIDEVLKLFQKHGEQFL
ncbi:54S ribosomal protein L39, mitochondrial [Podila epigama]|nr:54S ribosomal protein L39, mitochondrial [Podila epigama]